MLYVCIFPMHMHASCLTNFYRFTELSLPNEILISGNRRVDSRVLANEALMSGNIHADSRRLANAILIGPRLSTTFQCSCIVVQLNVGIPTTYVHVKSDTRRMEWRCLAQNDSALPEKPSSSP